MASFVIDDHLVRDILTGECPSDLDRIAPQGLATTSLWLFRLCSSFARPTVSGRLSAPVAELPDDIQARLRFQLVQLPDEIEVLPMRDISWLMADLQRRYREAGRAILGRHGGGTRGGSLAGRWDRRVNS